MAGATQPPVTTKNVNEEQNYTFALTVLTTLFFMWGFLTCLNDILIPHLKRAFDLSYTEAMLIQFVFFFAYFVVSLPSGWIIGKIGYKKGIVLGLVTAGIGALLFYPAAGMRSYPFFLFALFVLASGITLLQVSANPYVSVLGKPETASSRLNLAQAFNSLGTTIAPWFGSLLILDVAAKTVEEVEKLQGSELTVYRLAEAAAVQLPYLLLAGALFALAAIIAFIKLPKILTESEDESGVRRVPGSYDHLHESAWKYKHTLFGAAGIFVYVGAEVSIGSFLVNYLSEPYIAGFTESEAGRYVSYYWGGAMVGRFIGSALLQKIKAGKLLGINGIVAAVLVITTMLTTGYVAMWAVLLVGLFNSIMFPNIFTLGIHGLGKHTTQGSGILIMAIVGGAIIPVLQGMLADTIGIHHAFILPVFCYFYIAFYGLRGSIPEWELEESNS